MPKSFRLRQQPSKAPTSSTSVRVEVGVNETKLSKQLESLREQIKADLTGEFTKLKEELKHQQQPK